MKNISVKQKSISKRSRWLIIIGFLFFVNPVPFGLDILPDVFGCILLFFGFTQLAYFDSNIEEARKTLLYLLGVEALHLVMMRSVFLTNIGSNRLLAVTGFAIAEGILYVLFFKKLFSGMCYYSMRATLPETLKKSESGAFLSYLAFFVRLGAMVIPELIAILELKLDPKSQELDFETYDTIVSIIAAKPILVVLLTAVSLGVSVAWFVSVCRIFSSLHKEGGAILDARYEFEYTSRPEKTLPRRVRNGCFALYFALIFVLDVSFDNFRVIPLSFMFILLFASTFLFKNISGFKSTKKLAIPAFLLYLATEIYRTVLTPNGAIVIYETELWIVAAAAVIGIAAAIIGLLCIRGFLNDLKQLSLDLNGKEISVKPHWVFWCISATAHAAGFIVPYFHPATAAPRLLSGVVFAILTVRTLNSIYETKYEHFELYGE